MGLPRRAASDLRASGWDVAHVGALGMASAPDAEILRFAQREGRVVVTLDSDFVRLAALLGLSGPSVVHLRIQGLERTSTVRLLRGLVPRIVEDLEAGCIASVSADSVRIRRLPLER